MWRARTVLDRDKSARNGVMTQPCIWWGVLLVLFATMFEPIEQTTKAFDEYAIVTSATKDKSYWVDENSEL
jgi:hypothetical protein